MKRALGSPLQLLDRVLVFGGGRKISTGFRPGIFRCVTFVEPLVGVKSVFSDDDFR